MCGKSSKSPYILQCEMLCAPLVELFPEISPEELQYELLSHGLFDPFKWMDIRKPSGDNGKTKRLENC